MLLETFRTALTTVTVMLLDDDDRERAEHYLLFSAFFAEAPTAADAQRLEEILDVDFPDTREDIAKDFNRLFTGAAARLVPLESHYRDQLGRRPGREGQQAAEVRAFYSGAGLVIDEGAHLPPDHLSLELLFMSYLVESGLREAQAGFLEEHLLPWVPDFCEELGREAETSFCREVANVLREFVISDYEGLQEG